MSHTVASGRRRPRGPKRRSREDHPPTMSIELCDSADVQVRRATIRAVEGHRHRWPRGCGCDRKAATMSGGRRATLPIHLAAAAALISLVALPACGDDDSTSTAGGSESSTTTEAPVIDPGDGGNYHPDIDPADFVDVIDNPYLPYAPGASWVYEGDRRRRDRAGRGRRSPTSASEIMGISADGRPRHRDRRRRDGRGHLRLVRPGPRRQRLVPRRGHARTTRTARSSSTEGSWEAGVDGALPGIVMPAAPRGRATPTGRSTTRARPRTWPRCSGSGVTASVPFGDFDRLCRDRGVEPARARGRRGEVLRPRRRPGARGRRPAAARAGSS